VPIEPWWETNPATTRRQELGMVSPNSGTPGFFPSRRDPNDNCAPVGSDPITKRGRFARTISISRCLHSSASRSHNPLADTNQGF